MAKTVIMIGATLLLGSGFSWGHGAEYLFAKLTLCPDHQCFLEVTADYGTNPMLHGEEDARQAVTSLLKVSPDEVASGQRPAGTGRPLIEKRRKLDPTTPGYEESNPQETHQLLTAIWHWKPPGPSITLQVPPGTPYDALLWTVDQSKPGEKPHWTMLIAGETSPVIQFPSEGQTLPKGAWLCLFFMAAAGAIFFVERIRAQPAHLGA